MDIKDIKQVATEYFAHVQAFVLEYCLTKTVLIGEKKESENTALNND